MHCSPLHAEHYSRRNRSENEYQWLAVSFRDALCRDTHEKGVTTTHGEKKLAELKDNGTFGIMMTGHSTKNGYV